MSSEDDSIIDEVYDYDLPESQSSQAREYLKDIIPRLRKRCMLCGCTFTGKGQYIWREHIFDKDGKEVSGKFPVCYNEYDCEARQWIHEKYPQVEFEYTIHPFRVLREWRIAQETDANNLAWIMQDLQEPDVKETPQERRPYQKRKQREP